MKKLSCSSREQEVVSTPGLAKDLSTQEQLGRITGPPRWAFPVLSPATGKDGFSAHIVPN